MDRGVCWSNDGGVIENSKMNPGGVAAGNNIFLFKIKNLVRWYFNRQYASVDMGTALSPVKM